MVVDLQFGSTGKGLLAAYLAVHNPYTAAVTANGPNAGHTSYVGEDKIVRCILPNSPCHNASIRDVFIAPGASFYVNTLLAELADMRKYSTATVLVHPHACIVDADHAQAEKALNAIGSTQKGTMEAVVGKLRRPTFGANVAGNSEALRDLGHLGLFVPTPDEWERRLKSHEYALVEGSQGFSLGLNSGFYPYVTSRECSVHQLASDCLIPRRAIRTVYGSCRTFPIRVANRFDEKGNQVGWSGPCYPDQRETTFEEIGVPTEYTTVTKLPRRVFTFSMRQVVGAVVRNGVDVLFLNFANYLDPDRAWAFAKARDLVGKIESACFDARCGAIIEHSLIGLGPRDSDVVSLEGVRRERF